MSREAQVRFCERPRVKFPRATHRNVYVANERVGQRVLRQLRKVYERLKLLINETKTAVAPVNQRKLLGYTIYMMTAKKKAAVRISKMAEKKFKAAIRSMTKSSHSRSIEQFIASIAPLIRGWGNYFSLAPKAPRARLDAWIRRRLRMIQLKQWGSGTKARKMLRELGAPARKVHFEFGKQWDRHWYTSGLEVVEMALPARYFAEKGLPSLEG